MPVTIAHIGFYKAGLQTREIVVNVVVSEGYVGNWVKLFRDDGGFEILSVKLQPGPLKRCVCTLTVLKRQLQSTPTLTARELKEKDSHQLSEVDIRSQQASG